jgi:hypothetical protein
MWSLTFSNRGKRRVERVPEAWLEELEEAILQTQAYMDAIKEVMAINIELMAQTRRQRQEKVRARAKKRHPRLKATNKRSTSSAWDRSRTM